MKTEIEELINKNKKYIDAKNEQTSRTTAIYTRKMSRKIFRP